MILASSLKSWDGLFETSTKWFDVVIKMNSLRPAREKENKETKKGFHRLQVPGWDAADILLEKLEKSYGHLVMFFAAEHNAKIIGVKFRATKVGLISTLGTIVMNKYILVIIQALGGLEGECYGGYANGGDGLYVNYKGLLNDFRIMGEGLIDSIIVQKEIE